MTVSERVAYARGLYDGLGLGAKKSGEARVLSEILDVLRDVGLRLDGMDAAAAPPGRDLTALEDDGPDEDRSAISCPSCGERLDVDGKALAAGVLKCPACGGRFALSFGDGEKSGRSE